MGLEFVGDAISLSGLTGSKLKSEIIAEYYPFWWNITSGGEKNNHQWTTSIIELDAATGEMYIKDTKETILGSSGHALSLKCDNDNTSKLKIVCVEKDSGCYSHLKKVIKRRWPEVNILEVEGSWATNKSSIFIINKELDEALSFISRLDLGNSLFFFDPLRSTSFETIDKVARNRIKNPFQTGTEFIIFVFTSDWFLGRDDFVGLPETMIQGDWSNNQQNTVSEADELFGSAAWRPHILKNAPVYERENKFIELYKTSLHKWFRYVLPMPFNPKEKQIFHLILCSNFDVGVRATRGFFCEKAKNQDYSPDNQAAYAKFRNYHPELLRGLKGSQRPKQWRLLWKVITSHEEGICDHLCKNILEVEQEEQARIILLTWLEDKDYIERFNENNTWKVPIIQYKINWSVVKKRLDVDPPSPLKPLALKPASLKEISG